MDSQLDVGREQDASSALLERMSQGRVYKDIKQGCKTRMLFTGSAQGMSGLQQDV